MGLFNRTKKTSKLREADSYVSAMKENRRKRRAFLIGSFSALLVGLCIVGAGWVVLESKAFQIQEWKIDGNAFTQTDSIRNFLDIKILTASLPNTILGFQNMIAWPETSFESYAPELPRVKKINVTKKYLDRTITVAVEERVPFGIWCIEQTSHCFWFDTDGVLLDAAPLASGNLIPVVHDYTGKYLRSQTKVHDSAAIKNLVSVFDALRIGGLSVREVRLEDRELKEVRVVLNSGPELYFSLRFPATEAVPVIASLKKTGGGANPHFSELQYVDFRVERRAYYK